MKTVGVFVLIFLLCAALPVAGNRIPVLKGEWEIELVTVLRLESEGLIRHTPEDARQSALLSQDILTRIEFGNPLTARLWRGAMNGEAPSEQPQGHYTVDQGRALIAIYTLDHGKWTIHVDSNIEPGLYSVDYSRAYQIEEEHITYHFVGRMRKLSE